MIIYMLLTLDMNQQNKAVFFKVEIRLTISLFCEKAQKQYGQ